MNDMINLDNLTGSDDINVNDLEKIRAEIENKIEETTYRNQKVKQEIRGIAAERH